MSQGKFHLHWASPTRSILWFLSSLTLLCLSSYFPRSSYMEIPFFLLSSSVTTSISIQLQVLHLILKCPFPFKSVYTIFLSTKWGGGFLMQCFIVNKSKPILFLGCSFCALKNFKKKKKRLHTAGLNWACVLRKQAFRVTAKAFYNGTTCSHPESGQSDKDLS